MVLRMHRYDVAFEAFLRERAVPYVGVDETHRASWGSISLKSPDFVVYSPRWGNLVVDVKGRQCPGPGQKGRRWENWATADDIDSLLRWQQVFGPGFRAALVFAYDLPAGTERPDLPVMWRHRGHDYSFFGVWVADYQREMRTRSPRWSTVWVPSAGYRAARFSLADLADPLVTVHPEPQETAS